MAKKCAVSKKMVVCTSNKMVTDLSKILDIITVQKTSISGYYVKII